MSETCVQHVETMIGAHPKYKAPRNNINRPGPSLWRRLRSRHTIPPLLFFLLSHFLDERAGRQIYKRGARMWWFMFCSPRRVVEAFVCSGPGSEFTPRQSGSSAIVGSCSDLFGELGWTNCALGRVVSTATSWNVTRLAYKEMKTFKNRHT